MDDSEVLPEDRPIKQEVMDEEELPSILGGGLRVAGESTPEHEHLQQDSSTRAEEKEQDAETNETNGDTNNGLARLESQEEEGEEEKEEEDEAANVSQNEGIEQEDLSSAAVVSTDEALANTNANNNIMVLPACSPLIHHHHEQVTKGPQQLAPPLPSPQRPTMTVHVPKGKIVKMCNKHPNTEVTLDGKELWDEFYRRGTEMIVNRAGRRMFPGFCASVTGLKPKAKYTMKLEVILADNHRFKFLNARWLAVGNAEPQAPSEIYCHPDSPNTGSFWMRHGISFRKLKITNNKEKPGQNVLLHSMHKYFLRLLVDEERKPPPGESKLPPRPIIQVDFPETNFIAVTAYQNEEVTQLKISNNPFAKAFRENAADMDWETAQALYGSQAYLTPGSAGSHGSGYMMSPTATSWHLQSPMLSPLPVTPTLHSYPHSHFPALTGLHHSPHYSPDSPHFRQMTTATPYFQWPQYTAARQTSPHDHFQHAYSTHPVVTAVTESSPSSYLPQLPDFDSVFTSTASHS